MLEMHFSCLHRIIKFDSPSFGAVLEDRGSTSAKIKGQIEKCAMKLAKITLKNRIIYQKKKKKMK